MEKILSTIVAVIFVGFGLLYLLKGIQIIYNYFMVHRIFLKKLEELNEKRSERLKNFTNDKIH